MEIAQPSNPIHFIFFDLISSSQLRDEIGFVKRVHEVGGCESSSFQSSPVKSSESSLPKQEENASIYCHCMPSHFTAFAMIMPLSNSPTRTRSRDSAGSRCECCFVNLWFFTSLAMRRKGGGGRGCVLHFA